LDEFFRHENQSYPSSLSTAVNLNFGTKSDMLEWLARESLWGTAQNTHSHHCGLWWSCYCSDVEARCCKNIWEYAH